MKGPKYNPPCNRVDCFAHEDGHCVLLVNNNFGEKGCPFFKTTQPCEEEQAYCRERLAQIKGTKGE